MEKPKYRSWAIDHQPKTLKQCEHIQAFPSKILQGIIKNESFPHLFVYGLTGGGKRTLITCFLQDLFNQMKRKASKITSKKQNDIDDDEDATEEDEIKEEFKPFHNLSAHPAKLKEDSNLHILQSDIHIELSMYSMKLQTAQTILFNYLE